ncbi:hypothetical protein OROHE_007671 [Orobanche hederae]
MKESWLKVVNVTYDCSSFTARLDIASEGVVLQIYGSKFLALNRDDILLSESNDCLETWLDMFGYLAPHFYLESLVSPVPDANLSKLQ